MRSYLEARGWSLEQFHKGVSNDYLPATFNLCMYVFVKILHFVEFVLTLKAPPVICSRQQFQILLL